MSERQTEAVREQKSPEREKTEAKKKRKRSLRKLEQEFLETLCQGVTDEVLHTRLSYLLEWYTRKAQGNKHWYNVTRIITYAIPCAITLVSVFASMQEGDVKWAIGVTATLSAILVAMHHVIDHYRFYENWTRYRSTAEKLKEQAELYLNRAKPYDKATRQENRVLLARKMESLASSELSSWANLLEESHRTLREENQNAIHPGEVAPSVQATATAAAAAENAALLSEGESAETGTAGEQTAAPEEGVPE